VAQGSTELVVVTTVEADRTPPIGFMPPASFVSQLIASRDRLAAQQSRRPSPLSPAIAAYRDGERRAVRRLPQGFFRSAEV
jgi:hypothetical protein